MYRTLFDWLQFDTLVDLILSINSPLYHPIITGTGQNDQRLMFIASLNLNPCSQLQGKILLDRQPSSMYSINQL